MRVLLQCKAMRYDTCTDLFMHIYIYIYIHIEQKNKGEKNVFVCERKAIKRLTGFCIGLLLFAI